MIPEAAVEAAHARVQFHLNLPDFPDEEVQDTLRLALEAAAPHMLAEAWEAGHEGGKSDAFAADKGFTGYHANPYRPAK